MLWIWFCPVTSKELFLKIAAPKRQAKSLKTTCEVVSFYYICKLYTWNLLKTILPQAFFKGFAKITCDVNLYGTVRNLKSTLQKLFNVFFMINLLLFFFFLIKCLSSSFLEKPPSGCFS